jgi:glucose/arabinose dehydrogenase
VAPAPSRSRSKFSVAVASSAVKTDQVFSAKERYVSGIRNGEGFDFDTSGRLFVTQHGRDQLHEDWPELYTTEQGFELPAEEVMIVKDGAWLVAFPAHWAPNNLKLYKGAQFPKPYVGGAFIAFHGSLNRAPGPQEGYNVVFQPLADGKPKIVTLSGGEVVRILESEAPMGHIPPANSIQRY